MGFLLRDVSTCDTAGRLARVQGNDHSPTTMGVIIGTEASSLDAAGDLLLRCVVLESIRAAEQWLTQAPVTRDVYAFFGEPEALSELLRDGAVGPNLCAEE